jgi:hypothetical protein
VRCEIRLCHRGAIVLRVAPLLFLHDDSGVWKTQGDLIAVTNQAGESASMIKVQVRHDDMTDVACVNVDLVESVEHGAVFHRKDFAFFLRELVAVSGFNKNRSFTIAQENAIGIECNSIVVIGGRKFRPERARNHTKHTATVESKRPRA